MSILRSIARATTDFRPTPLPLYPLIKPKDIPKASILIFYGGTEITEIFGNYVYKHPFEPAAFHAAGYMENGEFLNIGKKAEVLKIEDEFRSSRRIDVISLLDITDQERDIICRRFRRDAGHNIYDVGGFLRKGSKLKALRFLKNVHSSDKNDFCSDNVVDNFSEPPLKRKGEADSEYQSLLLPRVISVSFKSSEDSAPWDLNEYAYAHPVTRPVNTLWVGKDFKQY